MTSRPLVLRLLSVYGSVFAAAALAYAAVLHLWHADLTVPPYYAYHGDVLTNLAWAKSLVETGSLYRTPLINAPLGGETYDFPLFCAAQLPLQLLFGTLARNGSVALNLVYLVSIPAAALSAFVAMRQMAISPWIAFAPSVLFALLPRFFGGEGRTDVPVLWTIPLSALLCVLTARADIRPIERVNRRLRITRGGIVLLVLGAVTGAGNQAYAFFAVALLWAATLIACCKVRSFRPVLTSVVLTLVVSLGLAIQLIPSFGYQLRHGPNLHAFTRYPQEAQADGLQIAQLVLPIQRHRGPAWMAGPREYFDSLAPNALGETSSSSLGTIGSLSFIALLGVLFARVAGPLAGDLESLALLNVSAVLLGTVSGFGALFNFFVNPDIRAYNRISLFVAFFAFAGGALIVTSLARRSKRRVPALARVAIITALIVFGAWDQTSADFRPIYAASAAEYASDARFVTDVESQIGSGAAFELPWMRYPEAPVLGALQQGDLFRPYLHATTLRVSYGAVEGRDPYDWQRKVSLMPTGDMIRAAVLGGFDGFIILRQGYADHGAALELELRSALGTPTVSPDGNLAFYSAKALRSRVVAADPRIGSPWYAERVVRALQVQLGPAFSVDGPLGEATWAAASPDAWILVRNDSGRTRPVELSALIADPQHALVEVAGPAPAAGVATSAASAPIYLRFEAHPGTTKLQMRTALPASTMPATAPVPLRLASLRVVPLDIETPTPAAMNAIYTAIAPVAGVDQIGDRRIRLLEGCTPMETANAHRWNWCAQTGAFRIESTRRERLIFSATVQAPGSPDSHLLVTIGNRRIRMAIHAPGTHVAVPIDVSAARPVIVTFASDARRLVSDDPRTLVFALSDPNLQPLKVRPHAQAAKGPAGRATKARPT